MTITLEIYVLRKDMFSMSTGVVISRTNLNQEEDKDSF